MSNTVNPIPEGFHSLTPHLNVDGAAAFIDFVKKAFGAVEIMRSPGPGGKLMHASVKIGDSMLMLGGVLALGIRAEDAVKLFETFNPGLTVPGRVARVMARNFSQPSWELQMARKDARLMLEAADAAALPLAMLPAIAATMDRFLALGHAHDDWTVIAKDALD